MKGTSHTLSLNMYVTLHNPNFSVLKYLTCFLSFPSSLIWPLCLSCLISVINKPQPSLYSGRHLNSRDTCLGPKDVPWIEVPLYSYRNIVLYIHVCPLINIVLYIHVCSLINIVLYIDVCSLINTEVYIHVCSLINTEKLLLPAYFKQIKQTRKPLPNKSLTNSFNTPRKNPHHLEISHH